MPKGYWIGRVSVQQPERYSEYVAAATPAYQKYGANFIVRGGRFADVEGTSRGRNVVIEFADYDTALACYNSPEYIAARAIRQQIAESDIIVIEGA
jgi:uncharacterized protein (DUF1330 family)